MQTFTVISGHEECKKDVQDFWKDFQDHQCFTFLLTLLFGCAGTTTNATSPKYMTDASGQKTLHFSLEKAEGQFDPIQEDLDSSSVVADVQQWKSSGKAPIQIEMHNRHDQPIIRICNLEKTRKISGSYISEGVFVDVLNDPQVRITVFPGGKIASVLDTEEPSMTLFPFAAGSRNVFVSIIGAYTDSDGKEYAQGFYKLEKDKLVLIQKTPNLHLDAKYRSYQDIVNGINTALAPR